MLDAERKGDGRAMNHCWVEQNCVCFLAYVSETVIYCAYISINTHTAIYIKSIHQSMSIYDNPFDWGGQSRSVNFAAMCDFSVQYHRNKGAVKHGYEELLTP